MNFLPCIATGGGLARGTAHVRIDDTEVAIPPLAQESADAGFVLGVRPEHVHLSPDAPLRAAIYGTEYLGTTQIVTLNLRDGTTLKARVPSEVPARVGDNVGLRLESARLTVFARSSGAALRSALHDRAAVHG
jgi:multiple sugar transport system ATP-binding protein